MSKARSCANTFREDEVRLVVAVVDRLLRGGDTAQLVRDEAFASVARKFQVMAEKINRQAVAETLAGVG